MYILSFTATQISNQVWSAPTRLLTGPVNVEIFSSGGYAQLLAGGSLLLAPEAGYFSIYYIGFRTLPTTGAGKLTIGNGTQSYDYVILGANQQTQQTIASTSINFAALYNNDTTGLMDYGYIVSSQI
jgi:hypothetical protein